MICEENMEDYECKCPSGYSGDLCEEDINECELSPCLNGGSCENQNGSFSCLCPEDLHGPVCDLVIFFPFLDLCVAI